jgi:hypothetical protein
VQVSVYLYDYNHCGGHEGLPLGTFRTDAKGTFKVTAPLIPLYFDELRYFENVGSGPAGVAYSFNIGLRVGPEETIVLKKRCDFTPEDSRSMISNFES